MEILRDIPAARQRFRELKGTGRSLGLVPTMGSIHEGHLNLIRRAVGENDAVAVSVFVNPAQFEDPGDLERYPRDFDRDRFLLEGAGADLVFYPDAADMYPDGYRYKMSESEESLILEGAGRPGHFDGVLTVVLKLLNIAAADRAYFGEKDWQQFRLISGMADALFMDTEIVPCPVVREKDGLAMSSRNARLSPDQRRTASALHRILVGEGTPESKAALLDDAGLEVEYVVERENRLLATVHLGTVRLIDNVPI